MDLNAIVIKRVPGFFETNYDNLEIYRKEYSIKEMRKIHREDSINKLLD